MKKHNYSSYLDKQTIYPFDFQNQWSDPDLVIVIPCHHEVQLIQSLDSLYQADRGHYEVGVIVVLNHSEEASDQIVAVNDKAYSDAAAWSHEYCTSAFSLAMIKAYELPRKKAGVGLARKIGMDKAVQLFSKSEKEGYLACYDADSLCLPNYINEVIQAFKTNPKADGYSIYYEHPLSGVDHPAKNYEAIIQYEAHLRYFIRMQKDIGLPFALQTVGSSMAVTATSYARFGGMNQRKAGEDFYFLQKFIENGLVLELNTTTIIPSPRISDRVPFGTGKAIGDLLESEEDINYMTYHPNSFSDLIPFIRSLESLYTGDIDLIYGSFPIGVQAFFNTIDFKLKIQESINNTSTLDSFRKRIFKHFNAFQLMKYVHYMRDHYYPNIPIEKACEIRLGDGKTIEEYLLILREMDRNE